MITDRLKLAFREYCRHTCPRELFCPFCGDTCHPDDDTSPDELCPNGCMKMAPQVTLRAGDAVEGGTIATFQADGRPLVCVDTRTRSWNEIQQLAAKQMAPIPGGATEDMPGHGCYAMPPGADPYRFEAALDAVERERRLELAGFEPVDPDELGTLRRLRQYGVPYEEVTQAQRAAIKSQRFGELYGVGAAAIKRSMEPLAVGDRVRRLPLEVYQSEGVIEEFREVAACSRCKPLALVRFAQASYSVLVNQDELVRV